MSTQISPQAKAGIEALFKEVIDGLEQTIDQYRTLYMQYPDDIMSNQIFAFCDEMEGLKRNISDQAQSIPDRVEYVGRISQYISDLIQDENEENEESTNQLLTDIDGIEVTIGMNPESINFNKDNSAVNLKQIQHEQFFKQKKSELDQFISDHPELNSPQPAHQR